MSDLEDRSQWMGRVWAWVRKVWPWAVTIGLFFALGPFGPTIGACAMTYFVVSNAGAEHAKAMKKEELYWRFALTESAYNKVNLLAIILAVGIFFWGTSSAYESVLFNADFARICADEISEYQDNPAGPEPACVKVRGAMDAAHSQAWPVRDPSDY